MPWENAVTLETADEIISLVNKRWVGWMEACGLEIQHWNCGQVKDVIFHDVGNTFELYEPKDLDPNRFCPMSKEITE
jgi:hypothetical protein